MASPRQMWGLFGTTRVSSSSRPNRPAFRSRCGSNMTVPAAEAAAVRTVVFISKATPGDDEFTLWLAPRLEAAGYTVFADIVTLEPGDRWRKEITNTLQTRAVKMLLCC